ncbi:MAG: hypothetical protein P8X86_08605 [Desulfofustis sp.]|jgi:nucleotide-binding universal stress UspA family protein
MIKALVSVYPDLASVIAMNYACRLSKMFAMEIQPIFVKEPEEGDKAPAVGWVRQTWENGLLDVEQEAMNKLIESERSVYAKLTSLQVIYGDRDEAILDNLLKGGYDLFVEGSISRFEKSSLLQRTCSRLYRKLPCSVVIARNLIDLNKILIIIGDVAPASTLLPALLKLFKGSNVRFDLLYSKIIDSGPLEPIYSEPEIFNEADEIFHGTGWKPEKKLALQGSPRDLATQIEEYSLVATSLPSEPERHNGLLELLSDTPSPILFCRQRIGML